MQRKTVILSLIPCYNNESYVPLYETGKAMKPLTELFSSTISKLCEEI